MATTLEDIAKAVGVSRTTVSKVLKNTPNAKISKETRNKILIIAKKLNYTPNILATALASGKTNLIGIFVPNLHDAYSMNAIQIASELVEKDGYNLIPYSTNGTIENSDFIMPADAYIGFNVNFVDNLPYNIVSTGCFYNPNYDYVAYNMEESSHSAFEHLIKIGCKNILFLSYKSAYNEEDIRIVTYKKIMEKHNLPVNFLIAESYSKNVIREAIKEYISKNKNIDAIFCMNDNIAIGCYRGLLDLKIKIPEDISIISCDGIDEVMFLETPISTIVHPVKETLEIAWKFLKNRMENHSCAKQNISLETKLVLRESTKQLQHNTIN